MFILLLLSTRAPGQTFKLEGKEQKNYRKISKRSQSSPRIYSLSVYHLANYLAAQTKTDLEKVRSIYVWISHNITYDMKGYNADKLPDYRPQAVLNNKVAVCEGYAKLFDALCHESGVRSAIIRGYSKGYGYKPGDRFDVSNHAWNAVFIDGRWQFIDVTWAALKSNDSKLIRPFSDKYFLAQPELFIVDHLPEIPAWQLLSSPISKEDFENNQILITNGGYNYQDSLSELLSMSPRRMAISYQLKARQFNPENDATNYRIGVEFRFRALDSLEAVYEVTERNQDRFVVLERQVFADLDEAALYFNLIKPNSRYYESAVNFLDDTDYERGIFKYETAHRLLEIFNTFSTEKKKLTSKKYEQLVLSSYRQAAEYFELIPTNSWYYEYAQNYLKYYLENPFLPGSTPSQLPPTHY